MIKQGWSISIALPLSARITYKLEHVMSVP